MFTRSSDFDAVEAKKRGGRKYMTTLGVSLDVKRWNEMALDIMRILLRSRWHHDVEFREILLETQRQGFHLVHFERSGSRSFWGGCISKEDNITVVGGNMLGKILMQMTHERLKSRSLSLRRVREVLMEMYVVCSRVFENFPYDEYTFFVYSRTGTRAI